MAQSSYSEEPTNSECLLCHNLPLNGTIKAALTPANQYMSCLILYLMHVLP